MIPWKFKTSRIYKEECKNALHSTIHFDFRYECFKQLLTIFRTLLVFSAFLKCLLSLSELCRSKSLSFQSTLSFLPQLWFGIQSLSISRHSLAISNSFRSWDDRRIRMQFRFENPFLPQLSVEELRLSSFLFVFVPPSPCELCVYTYVYHIVFFWPILLYNFFEAVQILSIYKNNKKSPSGYKVIL